MKDQYVLITGATSGLGLELSKKMANFKAHLILVSRSQQELQKVQNMLSKQTKVDIFPCNLINEQEVEQLVEQIKNKQFQLLILNAGIGFHNKSTKYNDYIKANTLNISVNQFLADNLETRQILFISSPQSLYTMPHRAVYASSKACMNHFLDCYQSDHQKVKIIKAFPRWFISNLRNNSLGSNQNKKQSKKAITAEKTAEKIVNQMIQGKTKVCLKITDRILYYLKLIVGNNIFSFCIKLVLK